MYRRYRTVRSLKRTAAIAALAGLMVISLSGCGTTGTSQPSTPPNTTPVGFVGMQSPTAPASAPAATKKVSASHAVITIGDTTANPKHVQVKVGGPVVWQNNGKLAHTIQIEGSVRSPIVSAGKNAAHVFKTVGTFTWSDPNYKTISGVVVVKAK
jgi:plastocyanin